MMARPASVISDATDAGQHAVQRALHNLKLHNATLLTLDVLAQCTESAEVYPARAKRAFVNLVLVAGTRQVAIEIA